MTSPYFRFWSQPEQRMYIDMTLEMVAELAKKYKVAKPISLNVAFALLPKLGIVPLQSTGLADKNGRAIFEGDIVRLADNTAVVEFDRGEFIAMAKGVCCRFNLLVSPEEREIEIMGNRFEHPHLLPS